MEARRTRGAIALILIDANVFTYASGAEHRFKEPAARFLEGAAAGEIDAAIDAEALQEILHRYRSIRRWNEGRLVFDLARQIVPVVLPVTAEILDAPRQLMDQVPSLSARDALHAAVAFEHTAGHICSFDSDFDLIDGIARTEPR